MALLKKFSKTELYNPNKGRQLRLPSQFFSAFGAELARNVQ